MRRHLPLTALLFAVACTPPQRADDQRDRPPSSTPQPPPREIAPVEPPRHTPQVPPLPTAALDPATNGFELLLAGAEPRSPLRLTPTEATSEQVELTLSMTVALTGTSLPPMRQVLPAVKQTTTATTSSIADGRITQRLVHGDLHVDSSSPNAAQSLQAAMQKIDGFEQTRVFDPRGNLLDSRLTIPEGTSAQLAKTLETIGKTVEQVMVRFPEQPVGVGGKWKVSVPFDSGGLELEQTIEFTLVAREGKRAVFETQLSQRPLTDKFTPPDQNTELDIVEFESKGASRIEYDLDKMLPDASHTKIETKFTTQTTGEQAQQLSFEMIVELEIARLSS